MRGWKRLNSKLLLSHPRLDVYEDEVELPSGKRVDYLRFGEMTDAVCVIPIRQDGKILVQEEYSYPPDEWLYQFSGGALHEREDLIGGVLRELAEEAGYVGEAKQIGWFYADNRRKSQKLCVFTVTGLQPAFAEKDPEEEFVDHWLTVDEIDDLIAKGKIVNFSLLAAWALFKAAGSPGVSNS